MSDSATSFDVIRIYDPAIVNTNSNDLLAEYSATREDSLMRRLVHEEGLRPVVFHCRFLTKDQRRHVKDYPDGTFRQHELAFRYGIKEVRDLTLADGTHTNFPVSRKSEKDPITVGVMETLEERFGLGDMDIAEVGSVIIGKSFLALGVPLALQPPASSVRACAVMQLRHAVRKTDEKTQTGA
jgi:hypothetical protein